MRVKEWLREGRGIAAEIEQLKREKLDLWDRLVSVVPNFEDRVRVQTHTRQGDDLIVKYLDYDKKIEKKLLELIEYKNAIENLVERLEKKQYRNLMRYYYIDCLTWEQVAEKMDIDVRWVYILHGRALEEMNDIINK